MAPDGNSCPDEIAPQPKLRGEAGQMALTLRGYGTGQASRSRFIRRRDGSGLGIAVLAVSRVGE